LREPRHTRAGCLGTGSTIVAGDVTRPDTLHDALSGVDHVIYTAGVTKRPAAESMVRATEFDGVLNTVAAASKAGFAGRFLLMGAIGTMRSSVLSRLLNLIKGNTLQWRLRAEQAVRDSGLEYTIVHAGILSNRPAGERPVKITQAQVGMHWRHRIGRADVAEVLVRALLHPSARNATFSAVSGRGGSTPTLEPQLESLERDEAAAAAAQETEEGASPHSGRAPAIRQ